MTSQETTANNSKDPTELELEELRVEPKDTSEATISDLGWIVYTLIGISVAILIVLYIPTFRAWWYAWTVKDSYYSHGMLIPPISAFIVYLKRKELRSLPVKPSNLGWLLLAPALAIAILASWSDTTSIVGLMFPAIIAGAVILLFGTTIFRQLLFPIAFLYFMCVIPTFLITVISFKIQILSTKGGTFLLNLLGLGAEREGVLIYLPYITVRVGAPCSGFRLLISLFAFSTLYAYLKEGPVWGKLTLVASTFPLSLIINSLRIALIGIVGNSMGSDAMHKFHDYSGYIVLVLAFLFLSLLSRWVGCRKFNRMLYS